MKAAVVLSLFSVFLAACGPKSPSSSQKSDAISRQIVGPAQPYVLQNAEDPAKIRASLQETRDLAWKIFAHTVGPVNRQLPRPDGAETPVFFPRVFSWYGAEDVGRLMSFSFQTMSEADLIKAIPVSEEQWTTAVQNFNNELSTLPPALKKKWARFFENRENIEASDIIGSTGLNRVIFSPDLLQSMISRYADLQDCFPNGRRPDALEAFDPCWKEALPKSSVLIKTSWWNAASAFKRFDTDAEALQRLFSKNEASWTDAAIAAEVPNTIVEARLGTQRFVLGGIHIVSKELEDWIWISAWWSDAPDTDFGEDRPDAVKALGAPWNQYKICAVSSFEQDPGELKNMEATHPSLAAAYRAVLDSGLSWCSNPYIEKGTHNPKTNCIGCHQFAGTTIDQMDILKDHERFPNFGKGKQRSTFPTDYIWAATQGNSPWLNALDSQLYMRRNLAPAAKP